MHLQWPNLAINRDPRAPKKPEDQQKDIDKAQKKIRDAFQIARAYAQARKAPPAGFKSDLRWEAMIPVVEGTLPLFVHADSAAQIEAALAWAKEAQMKFTLVGGREAWRMATQLKTSDTPVIIALTTALPPQRDDAYDSSFSTPARLAAAGVRFCISTDGRDSEAAHERNLPYEAAMAAAFGLPKEEALKAVTLYPAQLLGVADRLGSLELGKAATLDRDQRRSARFSDASGSGLHRWPQDRPDEPANAIARQVSRKISAQVSPSVRAARPAPRLVIWHGTFWNLNRADPDR